MEDFYKEVGDMLEEEEGHNACWDDMQLLVAKAFRAHNTVRDLTGKVSRPSEEEVRDYSKRVLER
jgi:hypothetical protein